MIHYFGIRHLSPAGAYYVREFLNQIQPEYILVEGGSDLTSLLPDLTREDVILPAAIMAYSETVPIQTLLYPFAEYSPEYQAIRWGFENGKICRLIDLPSSVFLAFQQKKAERLANLTLKEETTEEETEEEKEEEKEELIETFHVYDELEKAVGEDQESYWERKFEHCSSCAQYREAAEEYGRQLRELSEDSKLEWAETLLRERYMKLNVHKRRQKRILKLL